MSRYRDPLESPEESFVAAHLGSDVAIFSEHANPTRRVALDAHPFVIDGGIPVVVATADQYEDDFQYLVGQREDGAFSTPADEKRLEQLGQGATCARGSVGCFAQDPSHIGIALAFFLPALRLPADS